MNIFKSGTMPLAFSGISRLRCTKMKRAMTQKELADVSGVPLDAVKRLERSKYLVRYLVYLIRIAITLDSYLFDLVSQGLVRDLQDEIYERKKRKPDIFII